VSLRSPLPDLTLPDLDFSSFVLERARRRPGKTALVDGATGDTLTFGQLTGAVDALAGGLLARGLRPGDVVAVCGPNTPAYALAAHAIWRAGAVVVTVNPLFTEREMEQELADAGARALLVAPEALERALPAARRAGVADVIGLGEAPGLPSLAALAAGAAAPPPPAVDPRRDPALILYSSGTTGLPKGVLLTHHNLMAALYQLHSGDLAREDDVLIGLSPFFHVVGLNGILNLGIFAGATVVTMGRYDFEGFLRLLQDRRVSSAFLTPPVVQDLARQPAVDRFDLSGLRSILCAAAPMGAELEQAAAGRLGCVVRQGYGMTEACGPITTTLSDRIRRGSVGLLVPSTEAKVVDLADGHELAAGEPGEILVRGPQVMKGYLNQPEATAATLEPDGWLHTGDVGLFDPDDFLWLVDRVKEIIKYKAYQVAPAELEAVLLSHPAIADAAVVPSPDPEAGEVPKAFVVLRPGASAAEADLLGFVAERVAPYKKVRRLEFIDAIPKSPTGKILRRLLVERERAARAAPYTR
jgi:acyl-CoA synthetase (AMP-forming)/AMP-acid ligase II